MSMLMKSISGIRGVFGTAITPENVMRFASIFGKFQVERICSKNNLSRKKLILIGRDSRTTGDALSHAAIAGLLSVGIDVVWVGIVSTPTLLYNVKIQDAIGGICITASHNPAQWNAMKFVDADGMFLDSDVMARFLQVIEDMQDIEYVAYGEVGTKSEDYDASFRHIKKILSIPYLNAKNIRDKKYKVVLDSVNGAGGVVSSTLLLSLGCEVIEINNNPDGLFPRDPEPLSKNLTQICEAVKLHQADVGFATDPDVDRLAIIDEKGVCIGEELSLQLASKYVLSHAKGDIVTNLSTSMAIDDIAANFGVHVIRTKVGEINVGKKMVEIQSPVGGEGNGGVICAAVNHTRDAIAGMALILGYMTQSGKTISQLADEIPRYYFAKEKIATTDPKPIMEKAERQTLYPDALVDRTDGIKLILYKAWIHIRKSGTEPIIRVYVEADSSTRASEICQQIIQYLTTKK
jgi:phosphomannomutase